MRIKLRINIDKMEWETLHNWAYHFRKKNKLTSHQFLLYLNIPITDYKKMLLSKQGKYITPSKRPDTEGKELFEALKLSKQQINYSNIETFQKQVSDYEKCEDILLDLNLTSLHIIDMSCEKDSTDTLLISVLTTMDCDHITTQLKLEQELRSVGVKIPLKFEFTSSEAA